VWNGRDHVVGIDAEPRALVLPPAARVVHVVPVAAPDALVALVEPWARHLTSIGADDDGPFVQAAWSLAPRARRARLGEMQRPRLDGPVDRRLG
jgi:hypothetical protein